MRFCWIVGLLLLAACSSAPPGSARVTLNDPYWQRVNVEVVITKRGDCDSHGKGYIATKKLVMVKNSTRSFEVPEGANLCWRHDANPDKPVPGVWSGWTKATLFPGQSVETDL